MKSFKELVNSVHCDQIRIMSEDEMQRLKIIMFQCYKDVAWVCKKNGLTIMLGGGSALGAVRHKGYIPWDDDFDVLMPRKDYELFKEIFEKELGKKYILNAPNYCGGASNRFPKILIKGTRFVEIGSNPKSEYNKIKIDIFVLENVPNGLLKRYIKGIWCTFLMFICSCVGNYEDKESFFSKTKVGSFLLFRKMIGKAFSFNDATEWRDIVDRACQYFGKSDYYGIPTGRKHYFGEILPKECYLPVSYGLFEGERIQLPRNYDKYLSNLYGDYMKLPPKEKREMHSIVDIAFN